MATKVGKSDTPHGVEVLKQMKIDEVSFVLARSAVLSEGISWCGIGALGEKSLHKIIKLYFEPRVDFHEIKYLGSVADIKNESEIIEVQTRGYEKLLPRLKKYLVNDRVTVVCPLAAIKHTRWLDKATGEITKKRKSPKSENIFDALRMLFGIRELIPHENLTVRLLFLDVDDFRNLDGIGKERKRRSTRIERIPNSIIYDAALYDRADYLSLIPETLGQSFTTADFAGAIKRSTRFTFYVMKTLEAAGVIYESGKIGRARAYSRKI